jgi:hypothetical protein
MSTTPDNTLADPEQLIADLRRLLAEREADADDARLRAARSGEQPRKRANV